MVRRIGILLLTLTLGTAASAEELREIEYAAMYEEFVELAEQGNYVKARPKFALRDTELNLSTVKVIVETPQGDRINVEIEPEFGASNFPIDKALIGSTVLTNAPAGTLGFGVVYRLQLELAETLRREDVVGSIEEYQIFISKLGFFKRLFASDLAGLAVTFEDDEFPSATISGQTIEGKNSQLLIPIDLVREADFSEITFSSIPSEIYFAEEK